MCHTEQGTTLRGYVTSYKKVQKCRGHKEVLQSVATWEGNKTTTFGIIATFREMQNHKLQKT